MRVCTNKRCRIVSCSCTLKKKRCRFCGSKTEKANFMPLKVVEAQEARRWK